MTFMAYGLFASSLTSNQVVAWILGWVPLLLFACVAYFVVAMVEGWMRSVFQQINVIGRFSEFSRGLVRADAVLFFVGAAVLFLFLAMKVVESRRWR
jgi:ABC-2 type transport system permease protein